jgi:hypothetical protein
VYAASRGPVVPIGGLREVVDGLGVFMFMHAILPQERLQALIDNSVEAIDTLDEHALHSADGAPHRTRNLLCWTKT